VVSDYTPERIAEICGIPAEEIVQAARMFAAAKNAMLFYSMGITQHTCGVDNVRTCANLVMLTGNIGRPGTGVNPLRGQNNVQGACDMGALPNVYSGYQSVTSEEARAKFAEAWGVEALPEQPGLTVTDAINAAAEGTLKGLFIMGENPMMSDPDQNHAREALEKLEFLAVQDIFPTPTTKLADVVLPATSYAEKDGTFTSTERRVQRVRQAIAPVGESRADWEILCDLAARAGYEGMRYAHPGEIMDEVARVTPSYGGISFPRLEQGGLQWPCPDAEHPGTRVMHVGKFTRGLGHFSPATDRPPAETPDAEYPLVLSTGRNYFQFHTGTMTRRTRLLEREERFPYVEVNTADAQRLGIRDRSWVLVRTRRGEVRAQARVTPDIREGVLFMPFHYEEGAANLLTNNALDPEAKIPEYKACAAAIRPAP
jgi:formate dehydrogenase major subunit/formate dehydrogenase alpha subunit